VKKIVGQPYRSLRINIRSWSIRIVNCRGIHAIWSLSAVVPNMNLITKKRKQCRNESNNGTMNTNLEDLDFSPLKQKTFNKWLIQFVILDKDHVYCVSQMFRIVRRYFMEACGIWIWNVMRKRVHCCVNVWWKLR